MKRKIYVALTLLLGGWLLVAQGCMRMRTSNADALTNFQKSGLTITPQTLTVNNRTMHYMSVGASDKPTLVFVHGSPGSWNAFSSYLKDRLLRLRYRLVNLDRPGFGYSNFGKAVGLRQESALISPVLHRLANGKPLYLIGHSLGGPMVIKLAADNPDLPIGGLVILAGSVSPADEPPERWRNVADLPGIRLLLPGALRPSNHELRLFKKDVIDLEPNFAKVTCPVVIIHGDKDPLVPPPNADYAKKMLVNAPRVDLIWLKEANHFIPWTRYDTIRSVLLGLHSDSH